MNKKIFAGFSIMTVLLLSFVYAAKPANVIGWSNGFPSGEHFNLNIHGKGANFQCDSASGGSSIFVQEYGTSEIQYIQNSKSTVSELTVLDSCAMGQNDPAKVQLPSGEYQVYARILAKPGKDSERSVVLYPKLIDACNDNATAPIQGFGDYIDCSNESLIGLGVITAQGVFDKESEKLVRIAPVKGKNQAAPITDLFKWSGYACNSSFDTNADGEITVGDIPADLNGDGMIDESDLQIYLTGCTYYDSEWVFNIADLVVYGWDYANHGSKLVQTRFYPI